jgi:hypothetical protein
MMNNTVLRPGWLAGVGPLERNTKGLPAFQQRCGSTKIELRSSI